MSQPNSNTPPRRPREVFSELRKSLKDWFRSLLDLWEDLDREGTIDAIRTNKRMQGANAWLLGCSIMIASLGLDLNSPAVIETQALWSSSTCFWSNGQMIGVPRQTKTDWKAFSG